MPTRTILALDLSTPRGDLAVLRGEDVVFTSAFVSERSHNAQVFAPLREALAVAGSDLDLIVIGTGPGSYTGVRIAIAAAQGVALSRSVPVIGWPSITAPADASLPGYRVIGDARRGSHYVTSVVEGALQADLRVMSSAEAQALVETQAGLPWLTFDARVPFTLPQIGLAQPSAATLAQNVLRLSSVQLGQLAERPLEPIYLAEAFITTARKPGKQVPVAQDRP